MEEEYSVDSFDSSFENLTSDTASGERVISTTTTTTPFKLQWSFGLNTSVPIINLSSRTRSLLAYTCSHVTVLYDYKSREMFTLMGHRSYVRTLSVDRNHTWLLTADFDEDSTVVVWDIESRLPICTLFHPHTKHGITAASLSFDAKYIITIGNEDIQVIKLWLWTYGRDHPDATAELSEIKDERIKEVSFSYENSNLFALTGDRNVSFVLWNSTDKELRVNCPPITIKTSVIGTLNNTAFISGTTKVFTGTVNGFIVVWNIPVKNTIQDENMVNIKSVPLQKANITRIVDHKGMIVTGNSKGDINFYNNDLKILYWCRECGLDFIVSISFDFSSAIETQSGNDIVSSSERRGMNPCPENDDIYHEEKKNKCDEIPSNITTKIDYPPKPRNHKHSEKFFKFEERFEKFKVPRDATLQQDEFRIGKFVVATLAGKVAWIDVSTLTCRLISDYFESSLTALDIHPQREYLISSNKKGKLFLFNYTNHRLMIRKDVPELPDLLLTLRKEQSSRKIIHISNIKMNKSQKSYPTALKYSPTGDILICAMENGILWVLNSNTLDPVDPIPFKHSSGAISEVIFSECSNFVAYFDDTMTIMVLKRNLNIAKINPSYYNFVGKFKSHNAPIKNVLFGPSSSKDITSPRLLSLGEDQELIEYDLATSGPFPDPGLVILETNRIERNEIPLSMNWYPRFGADEFIVISNSDYKFRLIDSAKKKVRTTVLGPTFTSPVEKILFWSNGGKEKSAYMVFATANEIGLQLLPFDGNPCKIVGMIGHPEKISWMRMTRCGKILFTIGHEDQSILMWKINFKSVHVVHRLGGTGLSPFYGIINGGKNGWLLNEMQDLFVLAQILQQGENTMETRDITDEICIGQIPNLLRAIGFYPSSYELENLMNEVSNKKNPSTGEVLRKIKFEDFVKLYINHRPTFGISTQQLQIAFRILSKNELFENFTLTKERFIDVLCGRLDNQRTDESYSDVLSTKEIETYVRQLIHPKLEHIRNRAVEVFEDRITEILPDCISYKDFATNIMGIESLEETRADNNAVQ